MKIALISPAGAMHRYNGMFHKGLHYAPITLALLAALVPAELNADVVIYDETAEAIPLDTDADVIAITCITGTQSYQTLVCLHLLTRLHLMLPVQTLSMQCQLSREVF